MFGVVYVVLVLASCLLPRVAPRLRIFRDANSPNSSMEVFKSPFGKLGNSVSSQFIHNSCLARMCRDFLKPLSSDCENTKVLSLHDLLRLDLLYLSSLPPTGFEFIFITEYPCEIWEIVNLIETVIQGHDDLVTKTLQETAISAAARLKGKSAESRPPTIPLNDILAPLLCLFKSNFQSDFGSRNNSSNRRPQDGIIANTLCFSRSFDYFAYTLETDMDEIFGMYSVDPTALRTYILYSKVFLLRVKRRIKCLAFVRPLFHLSMSIILIMLVYLEIWPHYSLRLDPYYGQESASYHRCLYHLMVASDVYLIFSLARRDYSFIMPFMVYGSAIGISFTVNDTASPIFSLFFTALVFYIIPSFGQSPMLYYLAAFVSLSFYSKGDLSFVPIIVNVLLCHCAALFINEWTVFWKFAREFASIDFNFDSIHLCIIFTLLNLTYIRLESSS